MVIEHALHNARDIQKQSKNETSIANQTLIRTALFFRVFPYF